MTGRAIRYIIHRLKEKFGTRAMASGEVGLRDAFAWQVGALDRGLPQMMDMVNATRIGIATATAGAMRRNAFEALTHTRGRSTFGRRLDLHPLMRDTLAELVVNSVAGLTAAMGVADLSDRADAGDHEATAALRLLTPLFKMHGTERARVCADRGHGGARGQRVHRGLAGGAPAARRLGARNLGRVRECHRARRAARHRARSTPRLSR